MAFSRMALPALLPLVLLGAGCNLGLTFAGIFTDSGDTWGFPDSQETQESGQDTETDDTEDTETDDPPPGELDVLRVQPDYGTTRGGSEVVIAGGPFDRSAQVTFGGWPATVLTADTNALTVRTPEGSEGTVDVSVTTDDANGVLRDGFTYWLDGTGKYSSYGLFYLMHYVGTYWTDAPADIGSASVLFFSPAEYEPFAPFGAAKDQCATSYSWSIPTDGYYPIDAPAITLEVPNGTEMAMKYETLIGGYLVRSTEFSTNQWMEQATYDLKTVSSAGFPDFSVSSFLQTPDKFILTAPDLDAPTPPDVSQGNIRFDWNGTAGNFVTIELCQLDTAGDCVIDIVCVAKDDGSFTVPSSVWPSWPKGKSVNVLMGRWQTPTGTFPFNNASSGFLGGYVIQGVFMAR